MRRTTPPSLPGGSLSPSVTFEYRSEQERVAIEQGVAFVAEMHSLAQTAVNTPDGWRGVKVTVFVCRSRAEPATKEEYKQRKLPAPRVRSVLAEIEHGQKFDDLCVAEAKRLEVKAERLSVLGDEHGTGFLSLLPRAHRNHKQWHEHRSFLCSR
jgi:hypothetical protein